MKSNLFSKHDNRHAFQSSGVYFGQGLGKRLTKEPKKNQHFSQNHTSWSTPINYMSTHSDGYSSTLPRRRCSSLTARLNADMPTLQAHHYCRHSTFRMDRSLLNKFDIVTKENFRRFPQSHSLPHNLSSLVVRPSEKTDWWYSIGRSKRPLDSTDTETSDSFPSSQRNTSRVDYVTPLSVLAATQQPFLKHNPWTYSYKKQS